jgi:hypothetical protein
LNAVEIEEAISALAEQPFDAQEFPFAFLQAFDNPETTIKRLRKGETNKSDLGGVLQTNNIHLAVCAPGEVTKTLAGHKRQHAAISSVGLIRFSLLSRLCSPLLPIVTATHFRLSGRALAISARSAANGRRPQRQFDNPLGEKGQIYGQKGTRGFAELLQRLSRGHQLWWTETH